MDLSEKPLLRGHFHQSAFFAALGACAVLLAHSASPAQFMALTAYAVSLCGMCAVSALYHRRHWRPEARARMRRLDHAFIFVLIGGTATPICWIGMHDRAGLHLLALIWAGVSAGMVQAWLGSHRAKWFSVILYAGVAFLATPYLPELKQSLGPLSLGLLLAGGATYLIGAAIYAVKKPNPWPGTLGYHELFHLFVIVGAIFHFIVIDRIVG